MHTHKRSSTSTHAACGTLHTPSCAQHPCWLVLQMMMLNSAWQEGSAQHNVAVLNMRESHKLVKDMHSETTLPAGQLACWHKSHVSTCTGRGWLADHVIALCQAMPAEKLHMLSTGVVLKRADAAQIKSDSDLVSRHTADLSLSDWITHAHSLVQDAQGTHKADNMNAVQSIPSCRVLPRAVGDTQPPGGTQANTTHTKRYRMHTTVC